MTSPGVPQAAAGHRWQALAMDGLVDLLLLLAAFTLVVRSNSERDEVWALCLRMLAVTAVFAVITNVRGLPISLLLLALALWLPSAARFEKLPSSEP